MYTLSRQYQISPRLNRHNRDQASEASTLAENCLRARSTSEHTIGGIITRIFPPPQIQNSCMDLGHLNVKTSCVCRLPYQLQSVFTALVNRPPLRAWQQQLGAGLPPMCAASPKRIGWIVRHSEAHKSNKGARLRTSSSFLASASPRCRCRPARPHDIHIEGHWTSRLYYDTVLKSRRSILD
jgi:hypothetical protein